MTEKYLYIYDKKPGACSGWEKDNEGKCWQKCENEFCLHTSNIEHAKYRRDAKSAFVPIKRNEEETSLFEVTGVCKFPELNCNHQFIAFDLCPALCTTKEKPCDYLRG